MIVIFSANAVLAGSLTPPGSVLNTMYSLTDLYNLASGIVVLENSGPLPNTPETISPTFHSLTEVYELIAGQIANLSTGKIATGTQAFGITGTLYGDTDPTKVLTTATYAGTAVAGTPAPTFASAVQTTYNCEALATDPNQPAVTLETICGYHSGDGCSWSGGACIGGTKTPADGYMTWYAGIASCSEKTDEGSTSWRLPNAKELFSHYQDNNNIGAPPGFVGDSYWSGATFRSVSDNAYYINMNNGGADSSDKLSAFFLVHCAY